MVRIAEYSRTATFALSHDRIPYLVSGTASGTIDADFSNESKLELWSLLSTDDKKPTFSLTADAKFKDLDWSQDNKHIAGAMDNGAVEIFEFDAKKESLRSSGAFNVHSSLVRTVKFNSKQSNVLLSGGNFGEIFIWDLNKCIPDGKKKADYQPLTPGVSMSTIDEVHSLSWNKSLAHVFASASNSNFASIWDLKAKKEVIHLSYASPTTGTKVDFSAVEWHPLNSTRVATATSNDNDPAVLIWDLRNSNAPLQVLSAANNQGHGHSKGILSLDWCQQDENMLLSSARDSSVMLWNPQTGEALTEYTTTGNWCFKSKFAPQAPDLFAFATLDGKRVEVQTLQNFETTLDEEVSKTKQQESETDFWNHVSEEKSEIKSTVVNLQAPAWYGNNSASAQWAFGGKLVQITEDGLGVEISKPEISDLQSDNTLVDAVKSGDFNALINQRLVKVVDESNEEDWNLLEKLSMDGKEEYLKDALELTEESDTEEKNEEKEGDEFFEKIETNFQPSGSFKIAANEISIADSIFSGNTKKAVNELLKNGSILEAFVLATSTDNDKIKQDIKDAYFTKYGKESSLSRILYSSSKQNSEDLIENLDISQWKYITKSILSFHADDETAKNDKLLQLGDRLLESKDRQNALSLYIAAGSLDKIAAIWLKEFPSLESKLKKQDKTTYDAHVECLTEFIERFTIMSSFVGKKQKITNESLISKFFEFINITAATGNFELALLFLNILPEDNELVIAEKKRVLVASGKVAETTTKKTRYGSHTNLASASKKSINLPPVTAPVSTPSQFTPQINNGFPAANIPTPSLQHRQSAATVKTNPYAPPTPVAEPVLNAYAAPAQAQPVQTQPATSFIPPANPYSNVAAQSLAMAAQQPISPTNGAIDQPPPRPSSVLSGQTPHLNKKANDGWNDLPLPVKEKAQRAKPVTVAPIPNMGMASPKIVPSKSIASAFPPSNGSRNVSTSIMSPPPQKRASRNSSVVNMDDVNSARKISQAANMYAPQTPQLNQAPVSNGPPQSAGVVPPAANPYAPSANMTPLQKPVNPYAPPAGAQQPSVPASPYVNTQIPSKMPGMVPPQGGHVPPVSGPPPITKKASAGPPPIGKKRAQPQKTLSQDAASVLEPTAVPQQQPIASELASASGSVAAPPQAPPTRNTISPIDMTEPANDVTSDAGIPADQLPIKEFFSSELARVTPLTPKEYSKQLKDCEKRLRILFTHLERQDLLTQPTVDKLLQIIELLKQKNYKDAMEIHKDIATNHAQEGGNWLTGVKRIISISEATS